MKMKCFTVTILLLTTAGFRLIAQQSNVLQLPLESQAAYKAHLTGTADKQKEFAELKAKAETGDDIAQYYLGSCYAEGKGIEKNLREAAKWYHSSPVDFRVER